jgi:hypothetical protein
MARYGREYGGGGTGYFGPSYFGAGYPAYRGYGPDYYGGERYYRGYTGPRGGYGRYGTMRGYDVTGGYGGRRDRSWERPRSGGGYREMQGGDWRSTGRAGPYSGNTWQWSPYTAVAGYDRNFMGR